MNIEAVLTHPRTKNLIVVLFLLCLLSDCILMLMVINQSFAFAHTQTIEFETTPLPTITLTPSFTTTPLPSGNIWKVDSIWQNAYFYKDIVSDVARFRNSTDATAVRYGACINMLPNQQGEYIPDPTLNEEYIFDEDTDIFSPKKAGAQNFQYLPDFSEEKLIQGTPTP